MGLVGITIGSSFVVALIAGPLLARVIGTLIGSILRNAELLRLNFGIFALQAILTAGFLVIPALLEMQLNVSRSNRGRSICRCCPFQW